MAPARNGAARCVAMGTGTPAVRGGFVGWAGVAGAVPVPDDAIDPPIRPLVGALNATGWARTVFSCAGHPEEADAIATGRRQAHVDVVVRDGRAWKAWTRAVRREAPRAVAATMAERAEPALARLRVAEGGIGPLPEWLAEALDPGSGAPVSTVGPFTAALAAVATRLRLPWVPGAPTPWRYRRLVLEPVPYALEAGACRALLDVAIGAATACLGHIRADAR